MLYARYALYLVKAVFGPTALLLAAFALTLAWCQGESSPPHEPPQPARAGRVSASDDGRGARVRVGIAAGELSTRLILEGPGGDELASFVVWRTGEFTYQLGQSDPLRLVVHRSADRSFRVGGRSNPHVCYRLTALPDGSADFHLEDAAGNHVHPVRVSPGGRVTEHGGP